MLPNNPGGGSCRKHHEQRGPWFPTCGGGTILTGILLCPHRKVMLDDLHILAASDDRSWSLWNITQEKMTATHHAQLGPIRGVAMSPDQVGAAACEGVRGLRGCGSGGQPAFTRTDDEGERKGSAIPAGGPFPRQPPARPRLLHACCPAHQVSVATVGLDRAMSIWDLRQPRAERPALGLTGIHSGEATSVAWHPSGAGLATGGADGLVKLWDPRRGAAPAGVYEGHMGPVARVVFGPDGNWLWSAARDGCLIQWSVA
jgi:WD40 repeat protein